MCLLDAKQKPAFEVCGKPFWAVTKAFLHIWLLTINLLDVVGGFTAGFTRRCIKWGGGTNFTFSWTDFTFMNCALFPHPFFSSLNCLTCCDAILHILIKQLLRRRALNERGDVGQWGLMNEESINYATRSRPLYLHSLIADPKCVCFQLKQQVDYTAFIGRLICV